MAFSKLAEPYDQEVADMMFIDHHATYAEDESFVNEIDIHPNLYYIDGELKAVIDDRIENVRMHESIFNYLIRLMKREYELYYGEEYVMEHTIGDQERVLRIIYEEMDYPTLRDATCPYYCEGCRLQRECRYCSGMVSHCNAVVGSSNSYYCDENCYTAYAREANTPQVKKIIEKVVIDCNTNSQHLFLIDDLLKQKGKRIRFNGRMILKDKTSMLRTELEHVKKGMNCEYMKSKNELQVYKALFERNKPTFLHYFTSLQESYDEQMQLTPTSEELIQCASVAKYNIERIHKLARIFLGIREESN